MKAIDLSFNWFDLCVLAMLIIGIIVGRKRGMSLELLSVLQWLLMVFVAAMACVPFWKVILVFSGILPWITSLTAYLLVAFSSKIVFVFMTLMSVEKLLC